MTYDRRRYKIEISKGTDKAIRKALTSLKCKNIVCTQKAGDKNKLIMSFNVVITDFDAVESYLKKVQIPFRY